MASWNDPPALGCVVAADSMHDWQWVRAERRRGLIAWLAPVVLRCTRCARPPSDPWAQPSPAEAGAPPRGWPVVTVATLAGWAGGMAVWLVLS